MMLMDAESRFDSVFPGTFEPRRRHQLETAKKLCKHNAQALVEESLIASPFSESGVMAGCFIGFDGEKDGSGQRDPLNSSAAPESLPR